MSYKRLVSVLAPAVGESDAVRILDEVLYRMRLQKGDYTADEFIKICEELRNRDKRLKAACTDCITQARLMKANETLRKLSF